MDKQNWRVSTPGRYQVHKWATDLAVMLEEHLKRTPIASTKSVSQLSFLQSFQSTSPFCFRSKACCGVLMHFLINDNVTTAYSPLRRIFQLFKQQRDHVTQSTECAEASFVCHRATLCGWGIRRKRRTQRETQSSHRLFGGYR